ncbi:bifunctional DedA family/phosphatase PAP2 family protein [Thiofilum flexile]|uniref:bifunctional DedA family/phosphatase PAP2 family protein n=1 Tax=Thiofilum flexile TaxID=125627 RepID=UPI0003707914|nr:bifunctional DedA family/phosphatase PAP2 family protein [Thiofilum flexile]
MHAYLQTIMDYTAQHPWLAIELAFLISAGEALLVVGLFIPSTIVLVGLGGLVGLGKLSFWPIFLATALGAIVGDAVSYWIGHHYRERLYGVWPFSRYQSLLHKGQDYFTHHGGKSVVIGRFIPGVKAVVPGIAGMMGMNPLRFSVLNAVSAFAWAATHLLPSMSAGWLLALLAGVSRRLAVTVGLLLLLGMLLIWLVNRVIRLGIYYLPRWQQALEHKIQQHPTWRNGLLGRLILAEYAGFRQEASMYLLLGLATSGLIFVFVSVIRQSGLDGLDSALSQGLQGLRTDWSDIPMLVATLSGDVLVISGVVIVVLGVLLWQRSYQLLGGIVLAMLVDAIFIFGTKNLLQRPRPLVDLYAGGDVYSFPSGHAGFSALLAGLLIWFTLKGWQGYKRYLTVLILTLLAGLISLSRIYLGAHWPSDVLGSLFFSTLLVLVFAEVFRQENVTSALTQKVILGAGLSYILLTSWHVYSSWDNAEQKYQRQPPLPITLTQPWLQGGWASLPAYRQDLHGAHEEPFILQWKGNLVQLQAILPDWQIAPHLSLASMNEVVMGNTPIEQLPVLPKLQAGRAQRFTLQKPDANGRFVLRLYPQQVIEPDGSKQIIWLGSVTHEQLYHPLGQLSLAWSDNDKSCTAPILLQLSHAQLSGKLLVGSPEHAGCSGELVLGYGE